MSVKLITHSGAFHADEALAIFMLGCLPQYSNAKIIRTRDPALIETGDVVVDVGGVYDPNRYRFDHHQRTFVDTFDAKYKVKLSSAGLVYKHFGKHVIASILSWPLEHAQMTTLYEKVYKDLILAFDGVDNGVSAYPADLEPVYRDSTTIGHRVSSLNMWWNDPLSDEELDKRFLKAVELTGAELVEKVRYTALSWLPARDLVSSALEKRFEVHPSGQILVLDHFCPWKAHLEDLEIELKVQANSLPLYVLYQDTSSQWRIQAVAINPSSFESRKALPEPWRGVRDDTLSSVTGIAGCVFAHASGFIGGNTTKQGALDMAIKSLEWK